MAIKTRRDFFDVETNINTQELYRTSRLVSDLTGMSVQPNKAIVGANAFRHQSGIHQDGILKMRETYEIMDAKDIGWPTGGAEIVLGKVSGRHGFKARLEELGYELTEEELSRAFMAFKELADKKAEIDDRDLEAIVADKLRTTAGDLPPRLRAGVVRRPRDADGDRAPDRARTARSAPTPRSAPARSTRCTGRSTASSRFRTS